MKLFSKKFLGKAFKSIARNIVLVNKKFFGKKCFLMKFFVVKKTRNNNLLLKSAVRKPVGKKMLLFYRGKEVGFVFETIASIEYPFYLAEGDENLVGKTVEAKT